MKTNKYTNRTERIHNLYYTHELTEVCHDGVYGVIRKGYFAIRTSYRHNNQNHMIEHRIPEIGVKALKEQFIKVIKSNEALSYCPIGIINRIVSNRDIFVSFLSYCTIVVTYDDDESYCINLDTLAITSKGVEKIDKLIDKYLDKILFF